MFFLHSRTAVLRFPFVISDGAHFHVPRYTVLGHISQIALINFENLCNVFFLRFIETR